MSASVMLALAAVAAEIATYPVARFSRWRFLSVRVTVCQVAAAALLVASGAEDGHWIVCAAGAGVAVAAGKFAVISARARHQVTVHGGETGAGHG